MADKIDEFLKELDRKYGPLAWREPCYYHLDKSELKPVNPIPSEDHGN
jgi:hypothetical protein